MALTGTTSLTSSYRLTGTTNTAGTQTDSDSISTTVTWTDGTTAGKSDKGFSRKSSSFTGSVQINLRDLNDGLGNTGIILLEVTELIFHNTGLVDLTIGPATGDGWTAAFADVMTVKPGGIRYISETNDPALPTATNNKTLEIACPSGTGAYELHGKGRTA